MNGGGLARAAAPAVVALALAAILSTPPPQPETFSNIPQTLSGKRDRSLAVFLTPFAGGWIDDDDEVGVGMILQAATGSSR